MTEFEEYLRGTFEINNGIENDVDNLVRIHAPELLKLAKKELMKDAIDATIDIIYTPTTWLPDVVYDGDKLKELCKERFEQGDKVKVIILPSDNK